MVGIAGRSRACKTCRRRRKGCDRTQPRCLRCEKAGITCEGYETQGYQFTIYHADATSTTRAVTEAGASPPPLQTLSQAIEASMAKIAYFDLGWGSLHSSEGSRSWHHWIFDFPAVHVKESAIHCCYAAIALARVAQQHGQQALLQQSHAAHGRALFRTRQRLLDKKHALSHETLACVILLGVFEATQGCSPEMRIPSLQFHLKAADKITQSRGPSGFADPVGRNILRDMHRVVFQPMAQRQNHFLNSPEWIEEMWRDFDSTTEDDMFRTIARLGDKFATENGHTPQTARDILKARVVDYQLIEEMSAWRKAHIPSQSFTYVRPVLLDSERDHDLYKLQPWRRHYHDGTAARMEMACSTAQFIFHLHLLELLQMAIGLCKTNPQDTGTTSLLAEAGYDRFNSPAAASVMQAVQTILTDILESVEFFLLPGAGVFDAVALTTALWMTASCLAKFGDPRLGYLLELIERYRQTSGFPFFAITPQSRSRVTLGQPVEEEEYQNHIATDY